MTRRMRTSRVGIDLIRSFEGFRARAVRLADGRFLIGHGHTKTAREGATLSEADATLLLSEYDLPPIEHAVAEWVLAPLHQNEFDALVSFAFNIGLKAFRQSSVLALLNSGDKLAAAEAMSAWRKARLDGRMILVDALVRRRAAEKALFLEHPSGRPSIASALVRPQLDMSAAMLVPREKAVLVESAVNAEMLEAQVFGEDGDEDAPAERPRPDAQPKAMDEPETEAAGPPPASLSASPEEAARRVRDQIARIMGEEAEPSPARPAAREDAGPPATTPAAMSTEPSIEEITRAVSALAEPNGTEAPLKTRPVHEDDPDPELKPKTEATPKEAAKPAAKAEAAAPAARTARKVEGDDIAPAEDLMAELDREARRNGANGANGAGQGFWPTRWPWALSGLIGAGLMVFGLMDRFGKLPPDIEMSGTAFDAVPAVMILLGVMLVAVSVWNLIRSAFSHE